MSAHQHFSVNTTHLPHRRVDSQGPRRGAPTSRVVGPRDHTSTHSGCGLARARHHYGLSWPRPLKGHTRKHGHGGPLCIVIGALWSGLLHRAKSPRPSLHSLSIERTGHAMQRATQGARTPVFTFRDAFRAFMSTQGSPHEAPLSGQVHGPRSSPFVMLSGHALQHRKPRTERRFQGGATTQRGSTQRPPWSPTRHTEVRSALQASYSVGATRLLPTPLFQRSQRQPTDDST